MMTHTVTLKGVPSAGPSSPASRVAVVGAELGSGTAQMKSTESLITRGSKAREFAKVNMTFVDDME